MQNVFGILFLILLILWPVSVIKPDLFARFIKGTTRRKNAAVFGGLSLLMFTLTGITAPSNVQNVTTDVKGIESTIAPTNTPTLTSSPTPILTLIPTLRPTNTPVPTIFVPTLTPTPIVIQTQPSSTSNNSGGWACDCSKTCPEISSCAEAQYQLNTCGCTQRDGDHDGTACDSAPLHCQN